MIKTQTEISRHFNPQCKYTNICLLQLGVAEDRGGTNSICAYLRCLSQTLHKAEADGLRRTRKTTNSFVQKVPKLIADYVIALARVVFESGALKDNNLAAAITNQTVSLHGSGSFGYSGPGNAQCV